MRKSGSAVYFAFILLLLTHIGFIARGQGGDFARGYQLDKKELVMKSTVVLNNKAGSIPLMDIEQMKILSIHINFNYAVAFDSILNKYQKVDCLNAKVYWDSISLDALKDDIKFYNTVILQLTDTEAVDPRMIHFIREIEQSKRVIIAFWGTGKNLSRFDLVKSSMIWCRHPSSIGAMYVAQMIFGGLEVNNTLEASYSDVFTAGLGTSLKKIRLGYAITPDNGGLNSQHLQLIDTIALEAIRGKASPSAVVMVVKDGQVIYNKAFGAHTYADSAAITRIDDIYDLASVTKIAATTLGVMRLSETSKISLDSTLKAYIGRTRNTDKGNISVREIMLHQAGLVPFIPFYKHIDSLDFSRDSSGVFTTKVADHYYLRNQYFERVMWPQILKSPLSTRGRYVYSDLSMYFAKEVIEEVTGQRLDQYVFDQFYKPLGMKTAGFNPRNHFNTNQIIPTENDTLFRKTLLMGYVHDQGAAMAGGIAGHAGLFASANDLAILFQMLLDGGTYGGKQYFKSKTINLFTAKQSDLSRRGLGFDRADPDTGKGYPSKLASLRTYGHTGYTGTCVWVDPEYHLVYIFLSNRINPQVTSKLSALNTRGRIQDVIYEAIKGQN